MLGLALAGACESAPADEATDAGMADSGDVPDGPCVPGQSIACGCGGGQMGAAVCRDDGSGYDACSCDGDSSPSSAETSDGGETTATESDSGAEETTSDVTASDELSFERDIKPILLVSCGGSADTCHSRVAYAASSGAGCRGWFSFEDAAIGSQVYAGPTIGQSTGCPDLSLYDRLLQINSWQCDPDGRPIVAPGDPANSYMMMKIDGIDLCPDGEQPSDVMPPAGEGFALPESSRAKLEAWILAGAPNN